MSSGEILVSRECAASSSVNHTHSILFPLWANSQQLATRIKPQIANSSGYVHRWLHQCQRLLLLIVIIRSIYIDHARVWSSGDLCSILTYSQMSSVETPFIRYFAHASLCVSDVPHVYLGLIAHSVHITGLLSSTETHSRAWTAAHFEFEKELLRFLTTYCHWAGVATGKGKEIGLRGWGWGGSEKTGEIGERGVCRGGREQGGAGKAW